MRRKLWDFALDPMGFCGGIHADLMSFLQVRALCGCSLYAPRRTTFHAWVSPFLHRRCSVFAWFDFFEISHECLFLQGGRHPASQSRVRV